MSEPRYKVTVTIEEEGKEPQSITVTGDNIEAGDSIGYNRIEDWRKITPDYVFNGARSFYLHLWSDRDMAVPGTPMDMDRQRPGAPPRRS
jgi:hypothetical protein